MISTQSQREEEALHRYSYFLIAMAPAGPTLAVLLLLLAFSWPLVVAADEVATNGSSAGWLKAHATFYGGADGSGTMGGACGYGNLYTAGYGVNTAALSTALFNDGLSCGQCFKIACDQELEPTWCKPGATVTVSATNFCPPNWALPSDNGGWCNPPRPHFDMAQPAWELIGVYRRGIIPVLYQRVPCVRRGGVRFTMRGFDYFNLVLVSNVAGAGDIKSMDVKSSSGSDDWMPMAHNWGAHWHALAFFTGQPLSFRVTITDGQTLVFPNVFPQGWTFGMTVASNLQFK